MYPEVVVLQIFFKIGFPTNVENSTGKSLCWNLFLIKLTIKIPERRHLLWLLLCTVD